MLWSSSISKKWLEIFKVLLVLNQRAIFEMTGKLPDAIAACVGGGSNAMGIFSAFIEDSVDLYAIEPAGKGSKLGEHSASITYGKEELCMDLTLLC